MINKTEPARKERPPLNVFTLSFNSRELERWFNSYYTDNSLKFVKISLWLAVMLVSVFAILDFYVVSEVALELLILRAVCVLFFIGIIIFSYTEIAARYFQLLMSIVVITGGFFIISMILVSESFGGYHYYAGLILAIMFAHGLLRLRFIYATITTWVFIIAYELLTVTIGTTPPEILLNNSFFLFSANIMGMFASYWLEYYMRTAYWQTRRLKDKSEELKIEHDRKSRELESARNIQLSMLPDTIPCIPDYEFSFFMKTAAEVGGDYYDFTFGEDGSLTFSIGDATGHGAEAGAMVTAAKILFSNHASGLDILDFLKHTSQSLRNMGLRRMFMAFAIGRLNGNKVELSGAGLPPALIYRYDSKKVDEIPLKGLPLGGALNFPYTKTAIELNPNDSLLLMTDGFPELRNDGNEFIGYDEVKNIFSLYASLHPEDIKGRLMEYARQWSNGKAYDDDITFIIIQRRIKNMAETKHKPALKELI